MQNIPRKYLEIKNFEQQINSWKPFSYKLFGKKKLQEHFDTL